MLCLSCDFVVWCWFLWASVAVVPFAIRRCFPFAWGVLLGSVQRNAFVF